MAIKEVLHSDFAPKAVGPYSQAVVTGNLIFTSGQVPIDPKTGKIEAATIEEQTEQVMKNLHYVLGPGRRGVRPCGQDHLLPVRHQ